MGTTDLPLVAHSEGRPQFVGERVLLRPADQGRNRARHTGCWPGDLYAPVGQHHASHGQDYQRAGEPVPAIRRSPELLGTVHVQARAALCGPDRYLGDLERAGCALGHGRRIHLGWHRHGLLSVGQSGLSGDQEGQSKRQSRVARHDVLVGQRRWPSALPGALSGGRRARSFGVRARPLLRYRRIAPVLEPAQHVRGRASVAACHGHVWRGPANLDQRVERRPLQRSLGPDHAGAARDPRPASVIHHPGIRSGSRSGGRADERIQDGRRAVRGPRRAVRTGPQ